MSSTNSSSSTMSSTEGISAYFVLFSALLALVLVLSKVLHDHPALSSVFPEAGMILLVGMVAGFFVNLFVPDEQLVAAPDDEDGEGVAQSLLSFSPEVFFVALLPPIIFNSGYHLRRELFFRHIGPICGFAVVGTLVSALSITFFLELVTRLGLTGDFFPTFTELLTFGALISATDPVTTLAVFQVKRVDPHLFYLVFGESVLNDAVGLVLFNAFKDFVARDNGAGKVVIGVGEFMLGFVLDSVASPVLGLLCGCGAALLFKKMDMRSTPLLELSVYVLIVFVPFLLAEICLLSGIVTILFTGMAARAYVVPNLSDATAENAETLFRLLAHLAETSIFLELGLSVFGLRGNFKVKFILWAIVACLIGRALNVYPITFLYNKRLQTEPQGETELAECQKRHSQHNKGSTSESHLEMVENLHSADHHQNQPEGKHIPMIVRQESNLSVNTLGTLTPVVRRDLKISWRTAHMLCFSGLRGAVAYACVRSFPDTFGHRREFVVTTMCIILVTVFALGSTTGAMLNLLQIDMGVDEDRYMESWHQARRSATLILRFEEFIYRHVVRDATSTVPSAHVVESADVKYSTSPSSPAESSSPTHYNDVETPESFQTTDELGQSRHNLRKKGSLFDYGFER